MKTLRAIVDSEVNDQDQAAGTKRRNRWQPALSALACIP